MTDATFRPEDVDTSDGLRGTFGLFEYENAMVSILAFLKDKARNTTPIGYEGLMGEGWTKRFKPEDVGIDPLLFAMMCSAGWIDASYFPKYVFALSDKAVERLRLEQKNKTKRRVHEGPAKLVHEYECGCKLYEPNVFNAKCDYCIEKDRTSFSDGALQGKALFLAALREIWQRYPTLPTAQIAARALHADKELQDKIDIKHKCTKNCLGTGACHNLASNPHKRTKNCWHWGCIELVKEYEAKSKRM